jgi:hypothetical protein
MVTPTYNGLKAANGKKELVTVVAIAIDGDL